MNKRDILIDKISVAYGDAVPVRSLSLHVQAGEFLSLLGPSGCGKTTTLRSIAGFSEISEGDISIGGASVRNVPPNKRRIGMVYQDYALFPHMTVLENIGFGLRMRGTSSSDVIKASTVTAGQLQLSKLLERYPSQLSGGQQQRVALARALVIEPAVLLLDEPMAALDKQLRAEMQFELRQLQKRVGITTVFVTHDQEEALSLSDRIAVMQDGKILQIDAPDIVYSYPASLFVAEFIGTANIFPSIIAGGGNETSLRLDGVDPVFQIESRPPGRVDLLVRPEQIRIGGWESGNEVQLQGKVLNLVFVGATNKYQIELPSGQVIRMDIPAGEQRAAKIGEAVTIGWKMSDQRYFRNGSIER